MNKIYVGVAIILSVLIGDIQAQKMDFGDISIANLKMEVYEKDSTADAVIIFDVGEVNVDERLEVKYKRHVRIKVLTDNGLETGDIAIGFRDDNPEQKIRKIEAASYFLDENGNLKEAKLGRRDKFENEVSDTWSEIKFTIPGLRKGSIFEYKYEMISESAIDIPDWYFQSEIPTMYSDAKFIIPEWFNYLVYRRGFLEFSKSTKDRYSSVALFRGGGRMDYFGTEYHYVVKDAPAIKDEPYMKAKEDYYTQVRFQLATYKFPGEKVEEVLTTWPLLMETLNTSKNYGKRVKSSSKLKKVAQELIDGIDSEKEQMIAIYNHISKTMDWNNRNRLFVNENLDKIYESGTGNGTEINLLLNQMLQDAGLTSSPVILSTRNNGEVIYGYPIIDQFNHTIVKVTVEDEVFLLDARNEDRPYNMLPVSSLNGKGLVISSDDTIEWVELVNKIDTKTTNLVNATLTEEGKLIGKMNSYNSGFYSYAKEQAIFDDDEDSPKIRAHKIIFNELNTVEIDSLNLVENTDEGKLQFALQFNAQNPSNDSTIYLRPSLIDVIDVIDENPFKTKERTYPVDFDFPFHKQTVSSYFIPTNWEVVEIPQSKQYNLSDGGFHRRIFQIQGNVLSIKEDFKVSKVRFAPEEYKYLRDLFIGVVNDNEELIVIKKKQ